MMKFIVTRLKTQILIAIILVFTVNLSGCWSKVEIDRMAFISMAGAKNRFL